MSAGGAVEDKVKVLYIAGTGKSGSTLLGKLLGQVEGFEDVGELVNLAAQLRRGARCGCGSPVASCELWPRVLERAQSGGEGLCAARMAELKTRYLPLLSLPGAAAVLRRRHAQVARLQRAVRDLTGARVVVDGSKSAFYGAVLRLQPDLDVYTVHLVRDVRACEGSMYRLRTERPEKFAARTTGFNSLRWMLANLVTEWTARRRGGRWLRVRYEDLVARPRETLAEILDLVGERSSLDFIDGATARLGRSHNVAGSGVRFQDSPVELRLDERWRDALPEHNRALVDGLTRRFRQRYGY